MSVRRLCATYGEGSRPQPIQIDDAGHIWLLAADGQWHCPGFYPRTGDGLARRLPKGGAR